jgi:hypothetical protein
MKGVLDNLKDAGLIDEKSYKNLVSKGDYSPRKFIQYIDPNRTYDIGGRTINVPDSGIAALDEGSFQMLEKDSRKLLESVIARTQARIFKNNANKALYKLAKDVPENGIVAISKKVPPGSTGIEVVIGGKTKQMIMPNDMVEQWALSDPMISSQMSNLVGWISGTKILKPMATGINPEFALTNFPRDIAHVLLTTTEFSPTIPRAMAQMGREFAVTAKDAFLRKGAWKDYVNEGGGMQLLTQQGFLPRFTHPKTIGKRAYNSTVKTLENTLGYMGETSEIWTRLALRNKALRNGKSPTEATWIARNYLDFSQGGNLAKAIDSGVPYLNAAIQGTRGIIRAAKNNPVRFTYVTAQIGTLASSLYMANKQTNPEAYDNISDRDKVNNWIITTPLSYKDSSGKKRHVYFKIAKDQGQRAIASVFEGLMGKYMGEEINSEQIIMAVKEFMPLVPTQILPPTLDAILGYSTGVDFWRNEDIWRGRNVIPSKEYTKYTHPAFVKAGEATGLSPERLQYGMQQFFTYGNVMTSVVGAGYKAAFETLSEDEQSEHTLEAMRQVPGLRRITGQTNPYTKFEKQIDKENLKESTRRYMQEIEFDKITEKYYEGDADSDKVKSFIRKQPRSDKKRLIARMKYHKRLQGMPNKRWWLNLISSPPEVRATLYYSRLSQASETEKKELKEQLKRIPKIRSKAFFRKLKYLIKHGEKAKRLNRP